MTKRQLYHTAWLGKSSAMEPRCGLQWVVVQSTVPAQNYCAKLFFGVQLHFNIQWYFQNKIVKDLLLFTLKLIQITIRIYQAFFSTFSRKVRFFRKKSPLLFGLKSPLFRGFGNFFGLKSQSLGDSGIFCPCRNFTTSRPLYLFTSSVINL